MKYTGSIKKVALLSILGLFLFIPAIVSQVRAEQLVSDTEISDWSENFVTSIGHQTSIPKVYFYRKNAEVTDNAFYYVIQCDTDNQYPYVQCDGRQTPYVVYQQHWDIAGSETLTYFTPALTGLNNSKYYYIQIGGSNFYTLGKSTGTQKSWYYRDGWHTYNVPETYWSFTGAPPTSTISITYPTGGNITCPANTFCSQPINWIFSANNLTAGSSTIVYMNYQQGNSIDPTKYTNVDTLFFTPTSTIYSNSIQIGTYLTADLNYTARADLYIPPAGSPVATSTAITFSYSAGGYTYTTSTGFVGTTCNSTSVDFLTGLLCSAFVPQQISLTQFNTLYTKVSNKPPIGYLSAISTLISGTSTATTAIDNLNIPAGTSSPFTILRSGMIWILWLLFGFWVFTKIRHFQLW